MKKTILIFTKNLTYGKVKTRLAASIGNDMALEVYKELLQHTQSVTDCLPANKVLFYSDYVDEQDLWNSRHYEKQLQSGMIWVTE